MIQVDVWADVRCPWCWFGLRRLDDAVRATPEPVQVSRHAFLLEPDGPTTPGLTIAQAAVTEWGMSASQWGQHSERIRDTGATLGLDVRVDTALAVDSRPLHRMLLLAQSRGIDVLGAWEAAFEAHFVRNDDVSTPSVLRDLGLGFGLDDADVTSVLDGNAFADEVSSDLAAATALGIQSVPTVVADGRMLSGARSTGELIGLLTGGVR